MITREIESGIFPLTCAEVDRAVGDGTTPGVVAGFWQKSDPDVIWVRAAGRRRLIPSELPMTTETIFDLSSVSKIVATATLAARLIDRGWLNFETSVSALLPDFRYPEIQIQHLLSHTAGFIAWEPLWERLRAEFEPKLLHKVSVRNRQSAMRKLVFGIQPEARPGERALYSDISFLLLGFALEELTRMPLDTAVRRFLWDPMGLEGFRYFHTIKSAAEFRQESFAATEDCPWRGGVLQGFVHDDNCWAMGGYGGHAGVFGSVHDVLGFARGLSDGFLSPPILKKVWTKAANPPGCPRTLGWDTPSGESPSVGKFFSPATIGHLGYTGTSLWIDPSAGLAVALLTNRVHPSRENIKIRDFRPRFHDALRKDLERALKSR